MNGNFLPPRQKGILFHLFAALILIAGSGWGLNRATHAEMGIPFLVYLAAFLGLTLPIPLIVYRAYALLRSSYLLKPDGIQLSWGLRSEEIPMSEILWVSLDNELERPLPLPWLRWPGAVTGTRRIGNRGEVEYMAVRARDLIVIATPKKMYAISPEDASGFLHTFQRLTEVGSLNPISAQSIHPGFLLGSIWADRPARYTVVLGLALSLGLLIWISLAVPTEPGIRFYITGGDTTREIATVQLLLLPIANALFFLLDLLLGLFFYRRPQSRLLAYLLWGSSVLTSLLFFGAIYFIVQSGSW